AVNKIDLFCSGTTDVEVFLNANNGTISLYGSTTLFSAVGGTVGAVLDASSVSGSSKTFTFPNSSGTFALTSGVYSPGGTDVALADGGLRADHQRDYNYCLRRQWHRVCPRHDPEPDHGFQRDNG